MDQTSKNGNPLQRWLTYSDTKSVLSMSFVWLFLSAFIPTIVHADLINEQANFQDFFMGSDQDCSYDNWVSHVSEGIVSAGYNDYGPVELDRQTNGFGSFQLIPADAGGDSLLDNWKAIFEAFFQGNTATVVSLLESSGLEDIYEFVSFSDGIIVLREVLNVDDYFDNNGTPGTGGDDVTGSFDYGWGLYAFNPNATRPEIVIEVVHPCDDYIAPANALHAFQAIDAGYLFVNGAGREVLWTEVGTYYNSKSLSDPSRNARHPFQMAHEAAVDLINEELVIQLHSFDTESHAGSRSIELSVRDDEYPNQPLMDFEAYFDLISLTPEIPIIENSIGGYDHNEVTVKEYYGAYYDNFPYYQYRGYGASYQIDNRIDLWGYSLSPQMLYSHTNHDGDVHEEYDSLENWLHIEMDEFPDVIESTQTDVEDFYGAGAVVPTYQNFADVVEYYDPFYTALKAYYMRFDVPQLEWVMAGIPVSVPDGDPIQLFGNNFLDNDPGFPYWRVSRWDVAEGQYIRYQELELGDQDLGDPAEFAPGFGFWIIQNVAENCILNLQPNQITSIVDQTTRYGVAVSPPLDESRGLTQMANPFHYPYDWRQTHLQVDGEDYKLSVAAESLWVSGYAYTWDSSVEGYIPFEFTDGAEEPYILDTWQGFWFEQFNDTLDIEVMFTPLSIQDAPQGNFLRRDGGTKKPHKKDWALQLSLESADGNYCSDNNIAGVNRNSNDGLDFLDAIEFTPVASKYVQLYFPHPDWEVKAEKFTYDYRSTKLNRTKVWEFTVKVSNLPDREFVLRWPNIGEMNSSYFFQLEDDDEEVLCDLRETDVYRFNSDSTNSQEINFRLAVGPSRGGRYPQSVEEREDLVLDQFAITSIYPNPFNATTVISYSLPSNAEVTLTIFDLTGRRVTDLIHTNQSAGFYQTTWQAEAIPTGVYICRLQADNMMLNQKLVLVK
ncbi:T9SS type A sorting domain-containing protein [Calditrichota bacterium]